MNRNQLLNVWLPRLEYGLHWARMHLILLAVFYCLIYAEQVTRTNSLGQKLNTLVFQRDQVYRQVQELELKTSTARSLIVISANSRGLVEPKSVLFVKP